MYYFFTAATTNYHKLGGSYKRNVVPSQFRRLEVQNRGVGRAMLPLALWGRTFFAFSSFWWLLTFLDSTLCLSLQIAFPYVSVSLLLGH